MSERLSDEELMRLVEEAACGAPGPCTEFQMVVGEALLRGEERDRFERMLESMVKTNERNCKEASEILSRSDAGLKAMISIAELDVKRQMALRGLFECCGGMASRMSGVELERLENALEAARACLGEAHKYGEKL